MFTIGKFYIINDVLNQLYCGFGYGPTTNNKGMYTNLLKIILYINMICYIMDVICIYISGHK